MKDTKGKTICFIIPESNTYSKDPQMKLKINTDICREKVCT